MKKTKITNILVVYNGLPESCYSILSRAESKIDSKIKRVITNLCQKLFKNMAKEIIDEIIEAVKSDGHYVIGEYELFLINSIVV